MVNAAIERRAIHSETPAIRENETFRRNRSMLMAEQWPQKQLDNSTSGEAGTLAVVRGCLRGSPPLSLPRLTQNRPKRHSLRPRPYPGREDGNQVARAPPLAPLAGDRGKIRRQQRNQAPN